MSFKLKVIFRDTDGATAIEYGLIASLLVLGAIAGMNNIGAALDYVFGGVFATLIASTS
jgi:pilus assembly protein Flp/PilA